MANRAALAFVGGLAGGAMDETDRRAERARRDKIDAQNEELHRARMDEINAGRQQRATLADAMAPRTAQAGTVVDGGQGQEFYADPAQAEAVQQDRQVEAEMRAEQAGQPAPSLAQARRGYGVSAGRKAQISTEKPDLAALNSTDAKMKRAVDTIMASDPAKAISLSNAVIENRQRMQKEADDAVYRRISSFKTPQEMADFMTEYPHDSVGGKFKAEAVPSADGKSWSFMGEVNGKKMQIPGTFANDEDGMVRAREFLAGRFGDPNRRLEFYKWDREQQEKKRHNTALEGAANKRADAAATRGTAGDGNLNREERIRYTTLFNEAGRRLGEAKKTLGTLQKSALFMTQARTEGSPQAQQLQELQSSIKGYEEERTLYQGLLAGSQTGSGKKPPMTDTAPKPEEPQAMPTSKTALKKGAVYNTARGPARWNGTAFEAQ